MVDKQQFNRLFGYYTVCMRCSDLPFGAFRLRSIVPAARWVRSLFFLAVTTLTPFAAGFAQSQIGNGLPYPPPQPGLAPMNRTANPTADANRLMEDSMKLQNNMKRFDEMNLQRQKAMASEAEILIQLANQLKSETDKGTPNTDSILEIRKAELIEKLAHNIQHKMRESVSN